MSYIIVYTTSKDKKLAKKIASSLVEKKLAACVNVKKIYSFYMWKNKLQNHKEFELKIKTKRKNFKKIKKQICSLHVYDTPEIIGVSLTHGSKKYLKFIDKQAKG